MNSLHVKWQIAFYIFVAFFFSFVVRLIWVYQFSDFEAFKYAGQFMINTNDGYYWAEGARDLLRGSSQKFDLSPVEEAASWVTYIFAKILPFSFETVIFYMPAFFGSLIVFPLILIGHNFKLVHVGFFAALLASIAVSYYNRTMVGYYDTDMLTIVFPTLLLWSLILAFHSNEEKYLLITALEIIAYRWWYPQSYSLEFAFFGLILAYVLLRERKKSYYLQLLAIMMFAMIGLPSLIRLAIVFVVYYAFKQGRFKKYILHLLALSIVLFFATGGFEPIWAQLKGYVFKNLVEVTKDDLPLHFFSVMQTVREAGQISFTTFAERISGHIITLVLSIVGYIWMTWHFRVMLLGLPLVGLGFIALFGGLRFTIYAVPVCALGISYLLFTCSTYIQGLFINKKVGQLLKSTFVIVGALGVLTPNLLHIIDYRVPSVFNKTEVEGLVKLGSMADREDYVVSWWDYGYPIRYYSDVKTLIDGGKHSGEVNFPVSYILTNPSEKAAKLARFEVEYTEKYYEMAEANKTKSTKNKIKIPSNPARMTLDTGFKNANDFLDSLATNITLPPKTRDIFFYLPYRMMSIYPTVAQFSNLDIMSGKTVRQPFFFQTNRFQDSAQRMDFGQGVSLDKLKGMIKLGTQEVPLKRFVKTGYTQDKKLVKEENIVHENGQFSIIYMQSYNTFLILDEATFNASYIQLFVLENYDEKLFEPIILDPYAKVYKLKI